MKHLQYEHIRGDGRRFSANKETYSDGLNQISELPEEYEKLPPKPISTKTDEVARRPDTLSNNFKDATEQSDTEEDSDSDTDSLRDKSV